MWEQVIGLFRDYMGTGLIVIWFLVTVVYLLLTEKKKQVRILFVYLPVIVLLVFFNPLAARFLYGIIGDEIYYRILWLLPITVVIAYGAVKIYGQLKGRSRAIFAVMAAVLIAFSGSFIYSNPFFHKAENMYHIPQSVVDICDAIEVEGREVSAVFPVELLQYVRQYSPVVCMPYGRDITVERWFVENELYDVMEAEEIDAERLTMLAREAEYRSYYIILPEDKKINGSLETYEYLEFDRIQGYIIYKDATVSLEI